MSFWYNCWDQNDIFSKLFGNINFNMDQIWRYNNLKTLNYNYKKMLFSQSCFQMTEQNKPKAILVIRKKKLKWKTVFKVEINIHPHSILCLVRGKFSMFPCNYKKCLLSFFLHFDSYFQRLVH